MYRGVGRCNLLYDNGQMHNPNSSEEADDYNNLIHRRTVGTQGAEFEILTVEESEQRIE